MCVNFKYTIVATKWLQTILKYIRSIKLYSYIVIINDICKHLIQCSVSQIKMYKQNIITNGHSIQRRPFTLSEVEGSRDK